MKRKLLLTTVLLLILATPRVYAAADPTPTSSQTLNSQINQLKDKIASRVSQLNLVEKRGVIGTIQEVKDSQITLTTLENSTQYVDVDEITKFSSAGSSASFGISDLKKGMEVSILGIYNKESQRILGRYVDTVTVPTRYSGEIVSIDSKNYRFSLIADDEKSHDIDIETTTKISSYTQGSGLTAYGFSKLSVGDRVSVVGYPDKKNPSLLITDRLIDYLNAPKDPNIVIITPTIEPSIAPTSKGSKSISPIK